MATFTAHPHDCPRHRLRPPQSYFRRAGNAQPGSSSMLSMVSGAGRDRERDRVREREGEREGEGMATTSRGGGDAAPTANELEPAITLATTSATTSSTSTSQTLAVVSRPECRELVRGTAVRLGDSSTVFPAPIANIVTALATSARLSLRVTAFFVEAILESSQYGTRMGLGYTRRLLITAISSARRVYLASNAALDGDLLGAMGFSDKGTDPSADAFLNVLDRWTNLGIYFIHHTFTLAELFTMSGFYLTANTVQSANFAAQESVTLFDALFGSNESSRALASIITLVRKELLDDDRFNAANHGRVASLTALTKALTAFACLQNATWDQTSKRLRMRVLYDCTVMISQDESQILRPKQEPALPAITEGSISEESGPSHRNVPSITVGLDTVVDNDGDVVMQSRAPTAPPTPSPHRSRTSPDLELLLQLEELADQAASEPPEPSERPAPSEGGRRHLKRLHDDVYEITDELQESTVVTQTLERVASAPSTPRRRHSSLAPLTYDVTVEPVDDDAQPSGPSTVPTVVEDDETEWIEVDQLLDDDAESAVIPSEPNGATSNSLPRTPSSASDLGAKDGFQLVLRTMTNKLLQRKRTVRRLPGMRVSASPSPSPEAHRSRTPVTRDDKEQRPDVRAINWSPQVSSGASMTRSRTASPVPSNSPLSKGKGRAVPRRSSPPVAPKAAPKTPPRVPLKDEQRRRSREPAASSSRPRAYGSGSLHPGSARPREPFPEADEASTSSRPVPPSPKMIRTPPPSPAAPRRTMESIRTRSNRVHTSSSQIFSPNAEASSNLFPHEPLIKNIHRFMRYSSAAYGQSFLRILGLGNADFNFQTTGRHHANSWAFAQHTNIPIDSLLLSSYTESSPLSTAKAPPLVHYIAVEHTLKAVVLTCRGTLGMSDVLVDLMCDYREIRLEGGDPQASYLVHSGMHESALQLTAQNSTVHQTLVEALKQYPDYGLVLCGHSLGGGVASLLAIECAVRSDVFLRENAARAVPVKHPRISTPFVTSFGSGLPPGRPIHSYAYGVPAVASSDLTRYAAGLVTSVVQNADVVPTLSLGILRDLKNIAVTLFEENGVAEEIVTRVMGLNRSKFAFQEGADSQTSDEQALSDWMISLIKTMRADMDNDKLYPPGTVYIMEYFDVFVTMDAVVNEAEKAVSSKQAQRVILRQCESVEERFGEMFFSKTMLNDHLPSHYERSTQLLYEGLGQGLL